MSFRDYVDWLYQAKGAPYVWWLEGEVSRGDGPPAWAVNEPVPDISEINGGFCVAVYNLACRYFGVKIPNPYNDEAWDGGVAATWKYWYESSMWYTDLKAAGFHDGDLLVSPYSDASSQGHVAMVCHYGGVPYVIEWITNGGLVWNYTVEESDSWGRYQICIPAVQWSGGKVNGGETPAPTPTTPSVELAAAIDPYLGWHGEEIVRAAKETGLELALGCALVEQESGGENIFGCDHGNVGDTPPYCHQSVTEERVRALRDGGEYSYGMNGVGLTQLTWYTFVEEAEKLGGADLPENQLLVGFRILKGYVDTYPWLEALGAYNAGEGDRWLGISNGYAGAVNDKYEAWKTYLANIEEGEEPPVPPQPKPAGRIEDAWVGFTVDPEQWMRTGAPVPEGTWARFVKRDNGNYGLEFVVPDSSTDESDPTSPGFKGDVIEFAGEGEVLKLRGKMEITPKEEK